jgi:ADP-ribose pyrophosphatase YjhB (NUDIX family)
MSARTGAQAVKIRDARRRAAARDRLSYNRRMSSSRFERRVPDGDHNERLVCRDCGFINYQNPRIICGVVPMWEDKVLLCTRAIEPRIGFWTVPAGFMELGETPEEGAAREAAEEANIDVEVGELIGVYTIRHIGQVQMFYRGRMRSPSFSAGPESTSVELFDWDDIPWSELAFPTIRWALKDYDRSRGAAEVVPGIRQTPLPEK